MSDFWQNIHYGRQPNPNGVNLTIASHKPCAICNQSPWSTDSYTIVIKGQTYCGRCYTNVLQLFPKN